MTTQTLNPLIDEFETQDEKTAYETWLDGKVRRARQSRRLSNEEVQATLANLRAEWIRRLKDGTHS